MGNRDQEFLKIIKSEFPEYEHTHFFEERLQQYVRAETNDDDEKWERITAASNDDRIADYFLFGKGEEEFLFAELQRDYDLLSEEEAEQAIDKGIGQLSEVTDYGNEA